MFRSLISTAAGGFALLLVLVSCATPYKESGIGGGYGETRLSDSSYFVFFYGNGYASSERVSLFWLYRCAQLTLDKGFDLMFIRPGPLASNKSAQAGFNLRPAVWNPQQHHIAMPAVWHAQQKPALIPVKGGGGPIITYMPGGTITTWSSRGTVLMYHAPLPEELVTALDARKVLQQLQPYIDANGSIPAPSQMEIVHNAIVAHENITLSSGALELVADTYPSTPTAGNGVPNSDTAASHEPPLRPATDFMDRFKNSEGILHALFRVRRHVSGSTDGGSIALAFTVTPNGIVSDCHTVSTTFKDKPFVDAVCDMVRRFQFAPRDVASTTINSFTIAFYPLVQTADLGAGSVAAAPIVSPVSGPMPTTSPVTSAPEPSVVTMNAVLPESRSGCQQLSDAGIDCSLVGNASAGFELRMRPRDHSAVSTQRAQINALATIYCTEINKSGLAGTAAIENLQSHVETDRGCAGGAWSAWKPVTQSP